MKIAVISDIHGNMQALDAVLEDIKEQKCEKILCLGDIAMAGPEPQKAVEYVMNKPIWIVIQGNTDKLIADFSPEILKSVKESFPLMAEALANDVTILSNEEKEFLKDLPTHKKLNIDGVKILMVHGSPRRNNEDIMPNLAIEKVEEIIKGTSEDLILCGHTHIPCGYQTNNKQTVLNVGSVGRSMTEDLKACYAIIDANDGKFVIEHRFVDYDRNMAAKLLKKRKFKGSDKISEMLIAPTSRHC